jgi:uncharacterized membrane protein (DUF2068 family)
MAAMFYAWLAFFAVVSVIAFLPRGGHQFLLAAFWVVLAISIPVSIIVELLR